VSMNSLPIEENYVRFEVFTAVTMKNATFWDVNAVWLRVTANVVPSSLILSP
jgi:hypothetical protein